MAFPIHRLRRLRSHPQMRRLIRDVSLSVDHLAYPLFVRSGKGIRKEVSSMPGIFQLSMDQVLKEMDEIAKLSIPAVLLFGVPDSKDEKGSGAYAAAGIVQKALKAIKKEFPEILLMTDVCLCSYTSHGHCGIIKNPKSEIRNPKLNVDNDSTLPLLQKIAVSHAEAGADLVAPSGMMDGMVQAIREALDNKNFESLPIMAYSAKYASSFYGPFRDAAESLPQFGNRKSYQMDFQTGDEALREVSLDIDEGADVVMVKPALAYLDIIRAVKENFDIPLAAYHVSGEYSMVKAAAQKGWIKERDVITEILSASLRAGADILITYWAKEVARSLR